MSTRSGKRIHCSPRRENAGDTEISHNEIKTRNKRNKSYEEDHITEKKRKHYVKYPSEEMTDDGENNIKSNKPLRKSRRNTLVERNVHSEENEEKHLMKYTLRTKKNAELDVNLINHEENNHKRKDKKKIKSKNRALVFNENKKHNEQEDNIAGPKKKSSKKKNKKKSTSIIVKDIDTANEACKALNASEMSVDSFHSAAGSPRANEDDFKGLNITKDKSTSKNKKENHHDLSVKQVTIVNNSSKKKSKSDSNKLSTSFIFSYHKANEDTDSEKQDDNQSEAVNMTYGKQNDHFVEDGSLAERSFIKRKSNIKITVDKVEECSKLQPPCQKFKNSNEKKRKLSKKSVELCDTHYTYGQTIHEAKGDPYSTFDKTDTTFDKLANLDTTYETMDKTNTKFEITNKTHTACNKNEKQIVNTIFDKIEKLDTTFDKSSKLDTTFDKVDKTNTTFDKTDETNTTYDKSDKTNTTFDKIDINKTIFDKTEKSDTTFNKTEETNTTFDKIEKTNTTFDKIEKTNTTFDKISDDDTTKSKSDNKSEEKIRHKSTINKTSEINTKNNEEYEKTKSESDTTFDKISNDASNDSLIIADTSKGSHISLTSDESHSDNILNNTPVLVESSMEEHNVSKSTKSFILSALDNKLPQTPLKREGTFTKDSSEAPIMSAVRTSIDKTPTRRKSLPSPGCTPFPLSKSLSKEKSVLNVTHSIEKSRRSSLSEIVPRTTKVMFHSPSNNPAVVSQMKGKVIKSNLKGSNKSFIFEDSAVSSPVCVAGRKRSQTQGGVEPHAKRSRLLEDRPLPRVRSRTLSATAKIPDSCTPTKKADTPTKPKDGRSVRTKLPNFAALHQKQFAKMESLDECQERRAKRAKQLLTPNGALAFLERISPKENQAPKLLESNQVKKSETPTKSKSAPLNPGYSRFGFKLNLDNNPFSFTAKSADVKLKAEPKLKRQITMPSLTGTTLTRKEVAKQTILREKSFSGRRDENRKESRTVIKGVRTNRRFELQMKMRNLNA